MACGGMPLGQRTDRVQQTLIRILCLSRAAAIAIVTVIAIIANGPAGTAANRTIEIVLLITIVIGTAAASRAALGSIPLILDMADAGAATNRTILVVRGLHGIGFCFGMIGDHGSGSGAA